MIKGWKNSGQRLAIFAAIGFLVLSALGCGGGGGGDTGGNTASPEIQILPASHDFGRVTTNNSPAALEVKIVNNGSAALAVSGIVLSDPNNAFGLNLSGGSDPCGTNALTLAAGDLCTFEVSFSPTTNNQFTANVEIRSNDPNASSSLVALTGIAEQITGLFVRINQVECESGSDTAYVSVTDQGGYPVTGLTLTNFLVALDGVNIPLNSVSFVAQPPVPTISIAAVMDYSSSITDTPDAITDMENGLVDFFNDILSTDEGEIVKFDSELAVVQAYTSDKALLTAAILAPFDRGSETVLYDAVARAITDTAARSKDRKAVIVLTDGVNDDPLSTNTLDGVISSALAAGVPVFTIGIGSDIDIPSLQRMANETGGLFFNSLTFDNLNTIYQQLSSVLLGDQYILKFNGAPGTLRVTATLNAISGFNDRAISCP
jgi:VWFA-related protein